MSRTVDDDGSGLVLRPFRGVRYVQDAVDLAAVTSPPYDLIGPGEASRLEAQEPHNLVRLTLPDPSTPQDRYARAGRLLAEWQRTGVLWRDDAPALYVYEERGAGHVQRGLIGALGLRAAEEQVILPHEDVHPVPVADRIAQMTATGAHLEPIYLLVRGTGEAADVVSATAATEPLLTARATWNGATVDYRLWAVTDPRDLATVAAALRGRQALIADGHHRYAAYRALQAEHRTAGAATSSTNRAATDSPAPVEGSTGPTAAGAGSSATVWAGGGDGTGPWDYGLAFVVDSAVYPPTLQPIHRVVAQLKPAELLASLPSSAAVSDAGSSLDEALATLAEASAQAAAAGTSTHPAAHPFVVAGDGRFHLVTLPPLDPTGGTHSAAWYALDVSVLHQQVLGDLLHVPDEQVRFVHTARDALESATAAAGSALLLNPPTEADVHAVAAAGDRMPRKSTSFGPKPRNGLVLRLLSP